MENINNDELDLVTFSDEEGNEFQMEVWDYFEHEGQEYAILFDLESEQDEDAETEVYIMKVTVEGEDEIFLPADEASCPPTRTRWTSSPRSWRRCWTRPSATRTAPTAIRRTAKTENKADCR